MSNENRFTGGECTFVVRPVFVGPEGRCDSYDNVTQYREAHGSDPTTFGVYEETEGGAELDLCDDRDSLEEARAHASELAKQAAEEKEAEDLGELIQWIERQMASDDESREKQSLKLAAVYRDASPEGRAVLDSAFTALCGWSLDTAIATVRGEAS